MEKDEGKFEVLAQKIEEAFNTLQRLIEKIGSLESISDSIEEATRKINTKYAEAFSSKRLEQIRDQNQKALDTIVRDVKSIDEGIISIDAMRQQTQEAISMFSQRMSVFEDSMKQMRQTITETDAKLLKLLGEAGKQFSDAEDRVQSVEKMVDIHSSIGRFEQLLKIESENNRVLKDITSKLSRFENISLGKKDVEGAPKIRIEGSESLEKDLKNKKAK